MPASTPAGRRSMTTSHIGNFRTFLFEDVLRRALRLFGYRVTQVMNLTDVDDKTIRGAEPRGPVPARVHRPLRRRRSSRTSTRCASSAPSTTRAPPTTSRRWWSWSGASSRRGHTYRSEGSPTSASRPFPATASCPGFDRMRTSRRAPGWTPTSTRRRTRATSCCGRRPSRASRRGRPSSATAGRAGTSSARRCRWSCSARASTSTAGASTTSSRTTRTRSRSRRAPTGRPFARTWLHAEHLLVEGEKMAKSLGNFFTLRDLLERGYDPLAIRYLLISVPYRQKLNFTFDGLHAATQALERIANTLRRLAHSPSSAGAGALARRAGRRFPGEIPGRTRRRPQHRAGPGRASRPAAGGQHRARRRRHLGNGSRRPGAGDRRGRRGARRGPDRRARGHRWGRRGRRPGRGADRRPRRSRLRPRRRDPGAARQAGRGHRGHAPRYSLAPQVAVS